MEQNQILGFIFCVAIGIGEIWFGIWTLAGNFKQWYIGKGIPGFFPKDFVYNSIPMGVAFISLAFIFLVTNKT